MNIIVIKNTKSVCNWVNQNLTSSNDLTLLLFWSVPIKLGKEVGATTMMAPECGWVAMTIMVGVSKKKFFSRKQVFSDISYLATDISPYSI